jgi:putative transcriptional regulator
MRRPANRILAGLTEALAHAEGKPTPGLRVHVPKSVDVSAIRRKTGLSQEAFSARIGVSPATLRNWEQGRREPEGPARVLLALVSKNPAIVADLLGR